MSSQWHYPEEGEPGQVASSRTINATAPLTGGADLSADLTLGIDHSLVGADETLNVSGAISVAKHTTRLNASGGDLAMTLANGSYVGQRKNIVMTVDPAGHKATVTPATSGESFAAWVLDTLGHKLELEWQVAGWREVNKVARNGWERLYSSGAAHPAGITFNSVVAIPVPARDMLRITIRIRSYGIADTVSLQFNGDTGNNYYRRWLTIDAGGVALGVATVNEDSATSTDRIEVAGEDTTKGRVVEILVNNLSSKEKICSIRTTTGTGAAATMPYIDLAFSGSWVNTTEQITEVDLLTALGNTATCDVAIDGFNF